MLNEIYDPHPTSHHWRVIGKDSSFFPAYSFYHMLSHFCLTLCNPEDSSLPGSSVPEILQARILEWVVMPSSRGSFNTDIFKLTYFCLLKFHMPIEGNWKKHKEANNYTKIGQLEIVNILAFFSSSSFFYILLIFPIRL